MVQQGSPLSVVLVEPHPDLQDAVEAAFAASGQPVQLQCIVDAGACDEALSGASPDLIVHSPAAAPGALERIHRRCPSVPIVHLSDGPGTGVASSGTPMPVFEHLPGDQIHRLPEVAARAQAAAQQDRLERAAHAHELLSAHARTGRAAASVPELLAATCRLPLGTDWDAMSISLADADAGDAGNGVFTSPGARQPGPELAALIARAARAAPGAGWLHGRCAGAPSFALPIGNPPWAVLALVAAVPQPAQEDLDALAAIADDVDHARALLVSRERADLERDLRSALARRQLELFLQPKFDTMSRSLTGAEAIIRWRHPTRGLILPASFIPLLEKSGTIVEVGRWVRSEGLAIWQRWRELGFGRLRIAVNVSAGELGQDDFVACCEALLAPLGREHGLDIEITESMLMLDIGRSVQVLQSLRDLGCRIAIDDFGTGYSSLNYLSRLPADTLKVDQSFTAALATGTEALSMVTSMIGLAHSLGLAVVAEGVEDEAQVDVLRMLRCDELQGYLLGRPMPVDEFERRFLAVATRDAPTDAVAHRHVRAPRREGGATSVSRGESAAAAPVSARPRLLWIVASFTLLLALAAVLGWAWRKPAATATSAPSAASAQPAGAPITSIAVLPFADASPRRNNDYLGEGLAEELIERLARIPQLRVTARGSAFTFRDGHDTGTIARALGVASVLSGRLGRDADGLDLTVRLHAPDGTLLWSNRYRRPMSDLLRIEEELVRGTLRALRVELLPEQQRVLAARATTNPEAFNQYLLARRFHRQGTPESLLLAKSALEISVALDPKFAPAWAELAYTVSYLTDTAATAAEAAAGRARAREMADKAVALDPQSPAGYRVRASLRGLEFDFEGAMRDTLEALRLNSGDSDNQRHYALLLMSQGRLDEALLAATRAAELDPLSANAHVVIGLIHNAQHDPDAAIASFEQALKSTPDHVFALGNLVQAHLLKGDAAAALATARIMKPGMWRTFALQLAYQSAGDRAAADAQLAELVRTYADAGAYQIAEAYAWRGESDPAFAWLDRAFRQHDGGLEMIKVDPLLRSLRADPRYAELVERLKLPD